ncbi:MAG: 4-hydroxythreonine-4-phosphate dehydrogenase PdxA [Bacteroidetes bacterium]|nr:4-hydroxythreonine-4-phosphate dehydrogenase PdxA [Bacteroidota bacterium]
MADNKLKIGITHGDINGISYEIIIKALGDSRMCEMCTPIVYGSSKVAGFYKKGMPEYSNFNFNNISTVSEARNKMANLVNCIEEDVKIEVGQSTELAGRYAVISLTRAIDDLKDGKIDAIVTCPINKFNVQGAGFNFMGHTELFASSFGEKIPLMFMVDESIKVGIMSNHVSISGSAAAISKDSILEKLALMNESLIKDFGCTNPKIAVLGLNPHNGDEGLIGHEEEEIIKPAIAEAKDAKINTFGPFSADGFFASESYRKYDATLAMYHDQGMIPFKILSRERGVNFTAGLDIIRTSPAHGVAYDIAGKFIASEESLRNAIYSAIDIHKNREIHKDITANPLPFFYSKESTGRDQSVSELEDRIKVQEKK